MKDTVSLVVAQRLHTAGYKSECEWHFIFTEDWSLVPREFIVANPHFINYPAPSTAQLAIEIPVKKMIALNTYFGKWYRQSNFVLFKVKENDWHAQYVNPVTGVKAKGFNATSIQDALGFMMEYLLINNLI